MVPPQPVKRKPGPKPGTVNPSTKNKTILLKIEELCASKVLDRLAFSETKNFAQDILNIIHGDK